MEKEDHAKRRKKNPIAGFIIRLLLFIFILLFAGIAGLTVHYFFTIKQPLSYIPEKFLIFAEIPSLKIVYEDWINLEAADIILSSQEFLPIRKVLTDFRGKSLSKNNLFHELLNVRLDSAVLENKKIIAVFDLGWRSVVTRVFPALGINMNLKNITSIRKNGKIVFKYGMGNNNSLYFSFEDNLLILSTDDALLEDVLEKAGSDNNLLKKGEKELLDKLKSAPFGTLRILVDTKELLKPAAESNPTVKQVLDKIDFSKETIITIKLDNTNFRMELSAFPDSTDEIIKKVISSNPEKIDIISRLPSNTSFFSIINLCSIKDIASLAVGLQGKSAVELMNKADEDCKLLFGMGLDGLFFDWAGNDAGILMLSNSNEPVIFCRVRDQSKFGQAIDKIQNSIILQGDKSLVLDNIQLTKILVPDILQPIIAMFGVKLPTPYYIEESGYLFISLNPETLADTVNSARKGKTLANWNYYNKLSKELPDNPGLFLYYNLDQNTPFFINNESSLSRVLKLYGLGTASMTSYSGKWNIILTAIKTEREVIKPFPGFPVNAGGSVSGDIWVRAFSGSYVPSLIFIRNKNELVSSDLTMTETFTAEIDENSSIIPAIFRDSFFVYSPQGTFYRFDKKVKAISPFPKLTEYKQSFIPTVSGDKLLFFSRPDKKLFLMDHQGNVSPFAFEMPNPLLAEPALRDGLWALYPKSFDGKVYLADDSGTAMSGWPLSIDGISFGSPVIVRHNDDVVIACLTQSGLLYAWNSLGKSLKGFPFQVDGIFYHNPVMIPLSENNDEGLLILSEDGKVRILSLEPKILSERKIEGLDGKEARIELYYGSHNTEPKIMIYGCRNSIYCLTSKLIDLPGFPLKGNTRPQFYDLNQDGKAELVTGSIDDKIYAYTLPF